MQPVNGDHVFEEIHLKIHLTNSTHIFTTSVYFQATPVAGRYCFQPDYHFYSLVNT